MRRAPDLCLVPETLVDPAGWQPDSRSVLFATANFFTHRRIHVANAQTSYLHPNVVEVLARFLQGVHGLLNVSFFGLFFNVPSATRSYNPSLRGAFFFFLKEHAPHL